jgi:hypothetical protein
MARIIWVAGLVVMAAACTSTTTDDDDGGGGAAGQFADAAACEACVEPLTGAQGSCGPSIEACASDDACRAWLECTELCYDGDFTPACIATCDDEHPGAAMLSDEVQGCVCGPCATPCAAAC